MANALQERNAEGKLTEWVESPAVSTRLGAALDGIMPTETFIAHMLTAFQDAKVRQCSDRSKFTAIHECAAMGLLPTLGQVRLIPYKDTLQAMPQWQGFKALMERHPDILEVQGVLVHMKDNIEVRNGEPIHSFDPFNPKRIFNSVDDVRGGYLKILYANGRPPKYHFVTANQIKKAQSCAQTQNVWKSWYEQMALKTIYRDAYARRAVPIDPMVNARLQKIINTDDLQLGNNPQLVELEAGETKSSALAKELKQEPPEAIDIASEPEQEQQTQEEPEEIAVSRLLGEIPDMNTLKETTATRKAIPNEWSDANKQKVANKLDMREAEIRGGRGGKSNTMFDEEAK